MTFVASRTISSASSGLRPWLVGERPDVGGGVVGDLLAERVADVARRVLVIGEAEPMFVSGAIAATSAASVMNTPAEPARAPAGET